jgi:Tfp pilus assembly protein PilV
MTTRARPRAGFTLVETVVPLMILGAALLAMAMFVARMANTTTYSRLLGTANELAADRLETVKSAPSYSSIDSLYAGTEPTIAGATYKGFSRQTLVRHVGGQPTDSVDYRIVTVIVTNPALPSPVRKTTAIAAY